MIRYSVYLSLAIILLTVQSLSLLHMAEHGFHDHDHEGQECEITYACDKLKHSVHPAGVAVINPAPRPLAYVIAHAQWHGHHASIRQTARAPPHFS